MATRQCDYDKGYQGNSGTINRTTIHITGKIRLSRSAWRWFRRRTAIEAMFGHLKTDNQMDRNHLKGKDGDLTNTILYGCSYNLRKILRAFFLFIFGWGVET